MSVCVLYAYYEKNDIYAKNLTYFLENGLIDNITFVFIINDFCSVSIPTNENIHIINRPNNGFDFGAWNSGLEYLEKRGLIFDYYYFLNTSVRGPFIPLYCEKNWIEIFQELFIENVHLIGTSICFCTFNKYIQEYKRIFKCNFDYKMLINIQSMFFGITRECLEYLNKHQFFEQIAKDFIECIITKELHLTQLVINNGWYINCIIDRYRDKIITRDDNPTSATGDSMYPNRFFGRTIHPFECIFIKTNRNLLPKDFEN